MRIDIAVIGAGLVGLTVARAAEAAGFSVAVFDPKTVFDDPRASFVAADQVAHLSRLGVAVEGQAIAGMRIDDAQPDSPANAEIDGDLGTMVDNPTLRRAVLGALQTEVRAEAVGVDIGPGGAVLSSGHVASLAVAADGLRSGLRAQAGIGWRERPLGQSALTTRIRHSRAQHGVARQVFAATGPIALLPLSDHESSVVWSDGARALAAAQALNEVAFCDLLSARLGGLGEVDLLTPRVVYPLDTAVADRFHDVRLALVGDAAHIIHPLAGQGLNLGLRDAQALVRTLTRLRASGRDIGGPGLADYTQARRGEARLLAGTTAGLMALFGATHQPVRGLRRAGLSAVGSTGWLKRGLARVAGSD